MAGFEVITEPKALRPLAMLCARNQMSRAPIRAFEYAAESLFNEIDFLSSQFGKAHEGVTSRPSLVC